MGDELGKKTQCLKENDLSFSILGNNKGFINLRVLQKLNRMKTEWDQDKLYCLVEGFGLQLHLL